MDSWSLAFESMAVSEFVDLVGVWIRQVRARVCDGEVVLCSCVTLDKVSGVYNLIVKKRVTLKFIEDQERAVQSIRDTAPTELVFVGQTAQLIVRVMHPGDATGLKEAIVTYVRSVEIRMKADSSFVDNMWMVDAGNGCLYVSTEYRQMFALVCGEPSYQATARSGMAKVEISSWVENNIGGVKACTFIANKSGDQVSPLTAAKEYKNVTMHVESDRGDTQFALSDLYVFGTRMIVCWYKSLDSSGSSSSSSNSIDDDDKGGEIYSHGKLLFTSADGDQDGKLPSTDSVQDGKLPRTDSIQDSKRPRTDSVDDGQDSKRPRTDSDDDGQRPRTVNEPMVCDADARSITAGGSRRKQRGPSVTVDHALLEATKVIMDAARLQLVSGDNSMLVAELKDYKERLATVTAELSVCTDRLVKVTADRDRLKGIFEKLSDFRNKK
jgi:hypothetical protein